MCVQTVVSLVPLNRLLGLEHAFCSSCAFGDECVSVALLRVLKVRRAERERVVRVCSVACNVKSFGLLQQNNLSNPPTPPASLPPTPPPVACPKMANGFATTEELAGKAGVLGSHEGRADAARGALRGVRPRGWGRGRQTARRCPPRASDSARAVVSPRVQLPKV